MRALVFGLIFGLGSGAAACPRSAGLANVTDLLTADAVFLADIVEYAPDGARATFRLRPTAYWTGETASTANDDGLLTVTWYNSTFPVPKRIRSESLIFAIGPPESIKLKNGERFFVTNPDFPTVLRRSCGSSHIYVTDHGVEERLVALFDGKGDPKVEAEALQAYLLSMPSSFWRR